MVSRILFLSFFCIFSLTIVFLHHFAGIFLGVDRLSVFIIVVLFVNILFRYTWALALGVAVGFFLDQLSFVPAHWSIAAVLTLCVTNFLFIHFFTNRSLWTLLILGGVGTTIAFIINRIFIQSFSLFLSSLGVQLLIHTFLFIVLFYFVNVFTSRLKPYIIVRTSV
ncbi:MAG: hypothetical protein Q7S16_03440 [bacterium]|nr:hypothetical protein [bacterium]